MRASRRTAGQNAARIGLLCLSVAYLLLHLGGTWHLSRENHARCAEHGEWIEVAHPTEHHHTDPGPVAHSGGASVEHDHCVIVEASRLRAIACDDASGELAHGEQASIAPHHDSDPLDVGFARYLLAPKQSPPC